MGDLLWIGVLAVVYLVLKYRADWFNQILATVFGKTIGKVAMASQPDKITLSPLQGHAPGPLARSAVDALAQRGYAPAGSFTIAEMKNLPVHFLVRPEESAIAVVYEHPQAGVFTDIVCRYQDGRRFTMSNARMGGALDQQPGHVSVRKPGLSTGALTLAFQRERPAGSPVSVAAADVPRIFADAYADEVAWRKGKGVSRDEVRRVAREMRDPSVGREDAPAA